MLPPRPPSELTYASHLPSGEITGSRASSIGSRLMRCEMPVYTGSGVGVAAASAAAPAPPPAARRLVLEQFLEHVLAEHRQPRLQIDARDARRFGALAGLQQQELPVRAPLRIRAVLIRQEARLLRLAPARQHDVRVRKPAVGGIEVGQVLA